MAATNLPDIILLADLTPLSIYVTISRVEVQVDSELVFLPRNGIAIRGTGRPADLPLNLL